ncbi:MAG: hypothetical protein FWG03_08930 [Clostridiales bacterium]|nr:hypothetical protein [Clostridiales bacterium]
MKTYIYPENLKASAKLWLWNLRDFAIIFIALLISVFALAQTGALAPLAIVLLYAFLSIRVQDTSILDFILYASRHFIASQQLYIWRDSYIEKEV